ncbi:MAG: ferredoxin [Roseicyclus sp.]|nr:ferredoxin [Roseicyclus sp.]MBO6625312.1 ferredoxin [Roseicyclus sp.]MBO6922719.1 ferredoxin [Roseicyclus sp.]
MEYSALSARVRAHHLDIFGAFHPGPGDDAPAGTETLVLLGPREPGFWAHVTAEPEFIDRKPDPMDRWSRRVIGRLACDLGAKARFPFGGPPFAPFIRWATRTGRAWTSPVSILVHDVAGLMVSYRGALALKERIALPEPPAAPPCETCHKPCLTACPVSALTPQGYDTIVCHAYLDTVPGEACLSAGCAVRRACPLSQSYGRQPAQSAFHMRSFHP